MAIESTRPAIQNTREDIHPGVLWSKKNQNTLKILNYGNYKPTVREAKSGRFRYSRDHPDNDVDRNLEKSIDSETKSHNIEGQGIEKNIIPSNIINFYTKLEILW